MTSFGFWNVNLLRDEANAQVIAALAAKLMDERLLDVLFLIECAIPTQQLLRSFTVRGTFFAIPSGVRFKVIARFDPMLMRPLELPIANDRFDVWHLSLPLQQDVLIGVVHGLDKRNNSASKQEMFLQRVVSDISYLEKEVGHDRTIVLGDFNANPFESPMAGALGMHAVMSRSIAAGAPREMFDNPFPFFYNPMWNLFGDEPVGAAPATYYFRGSDPHELYWHMLDQVVIRPSLGSRFSFDTLQIVTSIRGTSLAAANKAPDKRNVSDHFPVVFEVNLTTAIG